MRHHTGGLIRALLATGDAGEGVGVRCAVLGAQVIVADLVAVTIERRAGPHKAPFVRRQLAAR